MNPISAELDLIARLLENGVSPKLRWKIGNALRASFRRHIAEQTDIHGHRFLPRKHPRVIRRGRTIQRRKKLLTAFSRPLRVHSEPHQVSVGHSWRWMAMIMRRNNEGLPVVYRTAQGRLVAFRQPRRQFLGWGKKERQAVEKVLAEALKNHGFRPK